MFDISSLTSLVKKKVEYVTCCIYLKGETLIVSCGETEILSTRICILWMTIDERLWISGYTSLVKKKAMPFIFKAKPWKQNVISRIFFFSKILNYVKQKCRRKTIERHLPDRILPKYCKENNNEWFVTFVMYNSKTRKHWNRYFIVRVTCYSKLKRTTILRKKFNRLLSSKRVQDLTRPPQVTSETRHPLVIMSTLNCVSFVTSEH